MTLKQKHKPKQAGMSFIVLARGEHADWLTSYETATEEEALDLFVLEYSDIEYFKIFDVANSPWYKINRKGYSLESVKEPVKRKGK